MKCLIIGSGGREHALAWKSAQSDAVSEVFVAPGNAGTGLEKKCRNVDIAATDNDSLLQFAKDNQIDLTIVGPEAPLVAGIVDLFREQRLAIFGPVAAAAELEGSKAYAKAFMQRHHIPSAAYTEFTGDQVEAALDEAAKRNYPLVIKADGLAAGKGVFIAQSLVEAESAIRSCLVDANFGAAGNRIVIEDFLVGEEASFIVMTDGTTILPMASSQDHKARDNGDSGPNTGGMGAYSPAPIVTTEVEARVMREVIEPVIAGMRDEGITYTGFLYAGLMLGEHGELNVLEFNCRLGDPETQVILPRLESDFFAHCLACARGELASAGPASWTDACALGVVLAAGGYPASYRKGDVINGLATLTDSDVHCFHAGTAEKDGEICTNGGRVLCLTARGGSVGDAKKRAYTAINRIRWDDMYYRTDIGHRAIASGLNPQAVET